MVRWATGRRRRRRGRRPSSAAARWKVNSCAGSPSPTATALSLLPFPADGSCRLFEQQWGEREANEVLFRSGEGERVWREQLQALRLQRERARECEESNYKRWGSSVYIYTGERVWSVQTLENILTSQRIHPRPQVWWANGLTSYTTLPLCSTRGK